MTFNEDLFGENAHPIYESIMFAMGTDDKGAYNPAAAAMAADTPYIIGRIPAEHRNNGVGLIEAINTLLGANLVQRIKGSLNDYVLTTGGRELVPELINRKSSAASK